MMADYGRGRVFFDSFHGSMGCVMIFFLVNLVG